MSRPGAHGQARVRQWQHTHGTAQRAHDMECWPLGRDMAEVKPGWS